MLAKTLMLSEVGSRNLNRAVAACVLTNFVQVLPFMIFMQLLNEILSPLLYGSPVRVWYLWLLFGFGILAAALFILAYKNEYKKTYETAYREAAATRIAVAEQLRKLPLSFFNRKDLSELSTNIIGDCTNIERTLSHVLPQMLATSISALLVCLMLALFNWKMALAVFCALPISIGLILIGKVVEQRMAERHVQAKLGVSDQVQEYLDGIKVVKAFGLGGEKYRALDKALKTMMYAAIKFETVAGVFVSLASMVLQSGIGVVVLVGVTLMTKGELGVVPFLTFLVISVKIYSPLNAILTLLPEFFYFLTATRRMHILRKEKPMTGNTPPIKTFDIEFDEAGFAYSQAEVLSDLSCQMRQREITALVGPSGSGKSTIARLIARFWDPQRGTVRIGGKDIAQVEPEYLMSYMSFVFQDVLLFDDTVANNVRLGKREASQEEIETACKRAQCHDFIMELPQGYETQIGENGCTLSGGERQRLSIARALLKDAPIVLLDEATAALDPENEVQVQNAISELIRDRTVIVIAHRLRTVRSADQIIVLDKGRIVESGKYEDLLAKQGLFASLASLQVLRS